MKERGGHFVVFVLPWHALDAATTPPPLTRSDSNKEKNNEYMSILRKCPQACKLAPA
jgi:hypothetical protein